MSVTKEKIDALFGDNIKGFSDVIAFATAQNPKLPNIEVEVGEDAASVAMSWENSEDRSECIVLDTSKLASHRRNSHTFMYQFTECVADFTEDKLCYVFNATGMHHQNTEKQKHQCIQDDAQLESVLDKHKSQLAAFGCFPMGATIETVLDIIKAYICTSMEIHPFSIYMEDGDLPSMECLVFQPIDSVSSLFAESIVSRQDLNVDRVVAQSKELRFYFGVKTNIKKRKWMD